jgi:hypothetical protein
MGRSFVERFRIPKAAIVHGAVAAGTFGFDGGVQVR